MRYCPVCDARYNDDVIKFCTKDGTPLIEEGTPNFTAIPSEPLGEPDEDVGEETIIRRRPEEMPTAVTTTEPEPERIVIPTTPRVDHQQQVRPRPAQTYYAPTPQPNTVKIVVLTILGTVFLLGCGAALFWVLSGSRSANSNVNVNLNANQNVNLNTNLGFDSNFNFNAKNTNTNLNTNISIPSINSSIPSINSNIGNANLRPTPTPRPSPTPKPSPTETSTPYDVRNETRPNPSPTLTPRTGPRPPGVNTNRPLNRNGDN